MAAVNSLQWPYTPGKPLSIAERQHIIQLFNGGLTKTEVSERLRVTFRCVTNVIEHYRRYGSVNPLGHSGKQPVALTYDILEDIEVWKHQKPSLYRRHRETTFGMHCRERVNVIPALYPT